MNQRIERTDVPPLQPPDSLHLQAAEGWIGLSNYAEANDELEQIAAVRGSNWATASPEKRLAPLCGRMQR